MGGAPARREAEARRARTRSPSHCAIGGTPADVPVRRVALSHRGTAGVRREPRGASATDDTAGSRVSGRLALAHVRECDSQARRRSALADRPSRAPRPSPASQPELSLIRGKAVGADKQPHALRDGCERLVIGQVPLVASKLDTEQRLGSRWRCRRLCRLRPDRAVRGRSAARAASRGGNSDFGSQNTPQHASRRRP
jgi:hypothetical protein